MENNEIIETIIDNIAKFDWYWRGCEWRGHYKNVFVYLMPCGFWIFKFIRLEISTSLTKKSLYSWQYKRIWEIKELIEKLAELDKQQRTRTLKRLKKND